MIVEVLPVQGKQDYFTLTINGVNLGEFERSELRELIGAVDNVI